MTDHESTDLAGAAHLAARDALPADVDRPSREELLADERERERQPQPTAADLDATLQLGIRLGWWK